MNPLVERILVTEWLYVAVMIFLSIEAFGLGVILGFLWLLLN